MGGKAGGGGIVIFDWRNFKKFNWELYEVFIAYSIAISVLVASMLSEALGAVDGDDSDDEDEEGLNGAGPAGSEEEEKQLQNMMFNLMVNFDVIHFVEWWLIIGLQTQLRH